MKNLMYGKKNKSGISLIVLVITISVILILAVAVIITLNQTGVFDKATKARFMNDYRSVQEGVNLYSTSKISVSNPTQEQLPLNGKLTLDDKQAIKTNVPTLYTKIQELNPEKSVDDVNLYWINQDEIGVKLSKAKQDKGYIIDVDTKQIYDYVGDYFANARWHTLDSGVAQGGGDVTTLTSPAIEANVNYPILTFSGVIFGFATITYDTGSYVDNYYSMDNGTTWIKYTGQIRLTSLKLIAKSINRVSGMDVTSQYTVNIPADAIQPKSYDGNSSTYTQIGNQLMKIDSSMQGKNILLKWWPYTSTIKITFLDENKQEISNVPYSSNNQTATIPTNATWLRYDVSGDTGDQFSEIEPINAPTFSGTNGYMLLTSDPTKAIRSPYQMVSISYFSESVQRLYQIGGTTGTWLTYNDQPIKVDQGQTIYTKMLDENGDDIGNSSTYTVANISDALQPKSYDQNDSTYTQMGNQLMEIDSSMNGQNILIKWYPYTSTIKITFLDENKQEISDVPYVSDNQMAIVPINARWLRYDVSGATGDQFYEIQPSNAPAFSSTNGYMLLTLDPTQAIRTPYQMVSISYSSKSVQRLYQIGSTTGTWLTYNDQPIKVDQGKMIYAKGTDKDGNDTQVSSSTIPVISDALQPKSYDQNDSTYTQIGNQFMEIDSSMQGKNIILKWWPYTSTIKVTFLDENKQEISNVPYSSNNQIVTVPVNAKWLRYDVSGATGDQFYEIAPSS